MLSRLRCIKKSSTGFKSTRAFSFELELPNLLARVFQNKVENKRIAMFAVQSHVCGLQILDWPLASLFDI